MEIVYNRTYNTTFYNLPCKLHHLDCQICFGWLQSDWSWTTSF